MFIKLIVAAILANPVHANPLKKFGFGLNHEEMKTAGYNYTEKSSGNEIYEKKTDLEYKKIVYLKNDNVATTYRSKKGTYFTFTKLNGENQVLGMAECKFQPDTKSYNCDVQTAELCQDLLNKVDTGGFGFDLNKIQECADISAKISYSRKSIDGFMPEVKTKLEAVYPGMSTSMIKAPATSLQTVLKDYAACKKAEADLAKPAGAVPAKKVNSAVKQGAS
ncbi:hypothetical protein ACLVWU_18225 [Bdellovibrio sp. HCB290]|uniref:hypothetical protein n=1 Tax=Bdellovibrio sp. HCB290 TaxID=3394356 RepID=UPI0039B55556